MEEARQKVRDYGEPETRRLPIHEVIVIGDPPRATFRCNNDRPEHIVLFHEQFEMASRDPAKVTCRFCHAAGKGA